MSGTVKTKCYNFQGYYNCRSCTDVVDPKRGCKFTHEECTSFAEYQTIPVPDNIKKEQARTDKALVAQGITPPFRQPNNSGQEKPPSRSHSPAGSGKGKSDDGKGKGKGKGKDGKGKDGKGKKGKGKGKRGRGAHANWREGDWYDADWYAEEWQEPAVAGQPQQGFFDTLGAWWPGAPPVVVPPPPHAQYVQQQQQPQQQQAPGAAAPNEVSHGVLVRGGHQQRSSTRNGDTKFEFNAHSPAFRPPLQSTATRTTGDSFDSLVEKK